MKTLRLALAQINPTVGDLAGNSKKIAEYVKKAKRSQADIVVFPELAVTGYPPEDLVLKPQFISDNITAIEKISRSISGIVAVAGFVDRGKSGDIYNAAALIAEGRIIDVYHKILLPNYGVFDEFRYFKPGVKTPVYHLGGAKIGINICEDIWHREGPACIQSRAGAELILNINASPYERGKPATREKILYERATENSVMIAYVNTVGGQDELVFDGLSMVFDHTGRQIASGKQFEEQIMIIDLDLDEVRKFRRKKAHKKASVSCSPSCPARKVRISLAEYRNRRPLRCIVEPRVKEDEEIYKALVLGTSDYVMKNGFRGVVIGLSGGIDSSLVAAVAADAVGKDNVTGLFMPSEFTSRESREDAFELAHGLGIRIMEISIKSILDGYLKELSPHFKGREKDITEENLQARIRGNLLMAFSNKFGWLVLTTGNKSEMSVGYATLYGDMAGGFAVIKDVPKTLVYALCRWRNSAGNAPVIPARVLWKEPTAELKPGQKDTDSLPPYDVLDPVLKAYVEDEISFEEILKFGCDGESVRKVIGMVDKSEYKRRQSPPGVKITARAFGRDRRFPITNRYRSY